MRGPPLHGVVVVDKPVGPTSFAIVRQARQATGARKVGHGGTLDPAASGVLPICFGEGTKVAQFLLDADKEYEATVRFGAETDSYDETGAVTARAPAGHLTADDVRRALARFVGAIEQVPPVYSALKRDGKPLYEYARAGEHVALAPRPVRIDTLELIGFDDAGSETPAARLRVRCSKGTYIRSLAYDLGRAAGSAAHLAGLCRTRSGPFRLDQAITPAELASGQFALVSPADALAHLDAVTVSPEVARILVHGKPITWDAVGTPTAGSGPVRLLGSDGALVAVAPRGAGAEPVKTLRVFGVAS